MSFVNQVRRRAGGRRRVPLDVLWKALAAHDPVAAQAIDARERLARRLEEGAAGGQWETARSFDKRGDPPLPKFVTLPAQKPTSRPRPVAWRPELSWAASLRLLRSQHDVLVAVNGWLARTVDDDVPVVPAAERSLEIFGDEKLIGVEVGGATLWQAGRLDAELLRFERDAPLIVWEQAGDGDVLLVVENQATFMSAVRVLRELGSDRYGAVAWGQGSACPSRIATAERAGMRTLEYFGDLDAGGLRIAADVDAAAREAGLGPVTPAVALYDLLLEHGVAQQTAAVSDPAGLGWLPVHQRGPVEALLAGGCRYAQEAVSYTVLRQHPGWR